MPKNLRNYEPVSPVQRATKAKLNLLDHFYEHLDEDDWLDGVDLYQAGRVAGIETYSGLISAAVTNITAGQAEVRLKIHPAGHCIQWIECTCRKNRMKGQYCEHIAAFMIHVDREKPELFKTLDQAMPLMPPARTKRRPAKADPRQGAQAEAAKGAAQRILEHLHGSIQSVSLLSHGPRLRVRIEIKEGQLTHYDLDLDHSAKFLREHPKLKSATAEVRALNVDAAEVELGTRIIQQEQERIVTERVIALKLNRRSLEKVAENLKTKHIVGRYLRLDQNRTNPKNKETDYLMIPMKSASRHMGSEYFFIPGKGYFRLDRSSVTSDWFDLPLSKTFKDDQAAALTAAGFKDFLQTGPVYLDRELQKVEILDAPSLSEIKVIDAKRGWFILDPKYGQGQAAVSMATLMREHRKKKRQYIRAGAAWMKIPEFITEHSWELDESGKNLKVDALGLMRLKAAFGDFDSFVGSKRTLSLIRGQLEFKAQVGPVDLSHTKLNLRQYQKVGLQWLRWLHGNHLHGLLADEMGLGKTHQAMALMSVIGREQQTAKFLVVCPTTVLDHWLDKVEDFAPNLNPVRYHGTKRAESFRPKSSGISTIITSYGVVLRDIKSLSSINWDAVILDEAHFVKNSDTATYRAVCRLNSRIRICLTGTPLENHLGELKNLFDFLVPGYLGSDEYFRKNFINPLNDKGNPETELALQKLIHPFKMRRTKELVLPDLPAKVEDLRHCSLSDEQVKMYREVLEMKAAPIIKQLEEGESPVPYLHVFAVLTLLKQICNHPALVTKRGYETGDSGKFELLKEIVSEALASGHKIVIYSQYVEMVHIIQSYLSDQGVGNVVLTGQSRNRGGLIKKFQTDQETRVFCGSLLAGGIGIDLTAASVVIHYDRWWNASKENQATDRVHRIGQQKNVQVLKLVTRGTLEEKIDRMISNKRNLFETFMDKDEELFKSLSRQELIELLQ